jgi:hypothetical protein
MRSCTSARKYFFLVLRIAEALIGVLLIRVTPLYGPVRIPRNPIAQIISTSARRRPFPASKKVSFLRAGGANFVVADDSVSRLMLAVFESLWMEDGPRQAQRLSAG